MKLPEFLDRELALSRVEVHRGASYARMAGPALRLCALAHAFLMGGLGVSVAQAQTPLEDTRERTRQTIEAVRAEQPGMLDEARSLGASLDATSARHRADLWRERARPEGVISEPLPGLPSGPNAPDGPRYLQQIQWPEARHPGPRRVLPRPAPPGADDAPRMQFTPDFSRQRLTLGVLAGRAEIDLPQQDISEPQTAIARSTFSVEQVLSLPDLVNVGLAYSPVMDQVLAQLETAINRRKQARADLMPRLSMRHGQGPEHSRGANVQPDGSHRHTSYSDSVRLTQPVFNLPLISDWMVELSNERAAGWRMHAAREAVALAVTQATLNVAAARLALAHSEEQLGNFDRLLAYVQERAQSGAASATDLERTRTRVLLARQTRIEQQAGYKSALLELQRLTGQSPQALRLPYLNQLPGLPATHGELRRVVWEQSFDLRALRADIEAQRRALASSQQRLLPVVGMSIEHDASRNVRGANARQVDQRVMGLMSWEFSLGGRELYGAGVAAAELDNRQARLTEQGERLLQQVDADFALLQSATLRVAAGQAEQLASAAVVAAVNEQLRFGRLGSLLEALDAYERHFAARQRLTQTLTQQMQAQAQLLARMGLLSDLREVARAELAPQDPAKAAAARTAVPASQP